MASGTDPELGTFELLPADIKAVQQVTEYAMERESELKIFNARVQNMGLIRLFLDSKVPRREDCLFNFSLRISDREEIRGEIERHLGLYKSMIEVADKMENSKKTEFEKENPYVTIINLNEKLTNMFELAQSGIETTTSKAISKLYREFLANQSKLENKIKRMECVFLKQQFVADRKRLEANSSLASKKTVDAVAYKEKIYSEMVEEANYLKEQNKELQQLIEQASRKLEYCEKHADLLKEKNLLVEN